MRFLRTSHFPYSCAPQAAGHRSRRWRPMSSWVAPQVDRIFDSFMRPERPSKSVGQYLGTLFRAPVRFVVDAGEPRVLMPFEWGVRPRGVRVRRRAAQLSLAGRRIRLVRLYVDVQPNANWGHVRSWFKTCINECGEDVRVDGVRVEPGNSRLASTGQALKLKLNARTFKPRAGNAR